MIPPRSATKLQYAAWKRIGANAQVLHWIQHGVPLTFSTEPEPCEFQNYIRDPKQFSAVDTEIRKLLDWNAIVPVSRQELRCVLPLQVAIRTFIECRL